MNLLPLGVPDFSRARGGVDHRYDGRVQLNIRNTVMDGRNRLWPLAERQRWSGWCGALGYEAGS